MSPAKFNMPKSIGSKAGLSIIVRYPQSQCRPAILFTLAVVCAPSIPKKELQKEELQGDEKGLRVEGSRTLQTERPGERVEATELLTDAPAAHHIIQIYALDDRIPEVDLVDHADVVEAIVTDDVAALHE